VARLTDTPAECNWSRPTIWGTPFDAYVQRDSCKASCC